MSEPAASIPDDVFDIVDENDQVIGSAPRREVHDRGLRHRAVHILIFNAAGEVFLQRRSPTKDRHPNTWDSSCSGHVDTGETYVTAALRELGEELGLEGLGADFLEVLFKVDACEQTGQEFVWIYRARHEGPFVLNPDEISGGQFFPPQYVAEAMAAKPSEFAPALRYVWPRVAGEAF